MLSRRSPQAMIHICMEFCTSKEIMYLFLKLLKMMATAYIEIIGSRGSLVKEMHR
jgi:hypothetical protein